MVAIIVIAFLFIAFIICPMKGTIFPKDLPPEEDDRENDVIVPNEEPPEPDIEQPIPPPIPTPEDLPDEEELEEEPETVTVEIVRLRFEPQTITIKKGTKVVWVNKWTNVYRIVFHYGLFMSDRLKPGDTAEFVFNEPGEYEYLDAISKGKGKVIVAE
jgi:plastocyanin